MAIGIFFNEEQVGFCRVVTDFATFAWLCDVFIVEKYRGKGLSKELMTVVMTHPELQNLRNFSLGTHDAHSLYTKFGFAPLKTPENMLQKADLEIYKKLKLVIN